MIRKEQELIRAILIWDNEEASETALTIIKGIGQQLNDLDLSENKKLDTLVHSQYDLDLSQNKALTVVNIYDY